MSIAHRVSKLSIYKGNLSVVERQKNRWEKFEMVVTQEVFGTTESGEEVIKYTIRNSNGLELDVISFGATLVSLKCPDR